MKLANRMDLRPTSAGDDNAGGGAAEQTANRAVAARAGDEDACASFDARPCAGLDDATD